MNLSWIYTIGYIYIKATINAVWSSVENPVGRIQMINRIEIIDLKNRHLWAICDIWDGHYWIFLKHFLVFWICSIFF